MILEKTTVTETLVPNGGEFHRRVTDSASIEAEGYDGKTPLHLAADKNSLDVATLLIENGADTNGIDLSWMDDQEDA